MSGDISRIQDEDVLRRMWQDTEDFGKKKEIRTHMYKLREERLRNFYCANEPGSDIHKAQSTPGLNEKALKDGSALTHADSLGDHSFLSLKSKEIRDSESPTRDTSYRISNKTFTNPSWDVVSRNETSDDGKTHNMSRSATTSGTERIPHGVADYAAHCEQTASVYADGDDKNYTKSSSATSKSVLQQSAKTKDGNRETQSFSTSATSTSKSMTQQNYSNTDIQSHQDVDNSSVSRKTYTTDIPNEFKSHPHYVEGKTRVTTETKVMPDGTKVTTTKYETKGVGASSTERHTATRQQQLSSTTNTRTTEEQGVRDLSTLKDANTVITMKVYKLPEDSTTSRNVTEVDQSQVIHSQSKDVKISSQDVSKITTAQENDYPVPSKVPQQKPSDATESLTSNTCITRTAEQKNTNESQTHVTRSVENKEYVHTTRDVNETNKLHRENSKKIQDEIPTPMERPRGSPVNETNKPLREDTKKIQDEVPTPLERPRGSPTKQSRPEVSELSSHVRNETQSTTKIIDKSVPFQTDNYPKPQDSINHETSTKQQTTYQTDYTSKRVSIDVSATHNAFASSLRAVSPERDQKRGSIHSPVPSPSPRRSATPDKHVQSKPYKPHDNGIPRRASPPKQERSPEKDFYKNQTTYTTSTTQYVSNRNRSQSPTSIKMVPQPKDNRTEKRPTSLHITSTATRKTKKVTERSPTSPIAPVKEKPLKRRDTYEDRCRQMLGIDGANVTKVTTTKMHEVTQPGLKEYPSQIRRSPEKTRDQVSPSKKTRASPDTRETKQTQITEYPSQIRRLPEKSPSKKASPVGNQPPQNCISFKVHERKTSTDRRSKTPDGNKPKAEYPSQIRDVTTPTESPRGTKVPTLPVKKDNSHHPTQTTSDEDETKVVNLLIDSYSERDQRTNDNTHYRNQVIVDEYSISDETGEVKTYDEVTSKTPLVPQPKSVSVKSPESFRKPVPEEVITITETYRPAERIDVENDFYRTQTVNVHVTGSIFRDDVSRESSPSRNRYSPDKGVYEKTLDDRDTVTKIAIGPTPSQEKLRERHDNAQVIRKTLVTRDERIDSSNTCRTEPKYDRNTPSTDRETQRQNVYERSTTISDKWQPTESRRSPIKEQSPVLREHPAPARQSPAKDVPQTLTPRGVPTRASPANETPKSRPSLNDSTTPAPKQVIPKSLAPVFNSTTLPKTQETAKGKPASPQKPEQPAVLKRVQPTEAGPIIDEPVCVKKVVSNLCREDEVSHKTVKKDSPQRTTNVNFINNERRDTDDKTNLVRPKVTSNKIESIKNQLNLVQKTKPHDKPGSKDTKLPVTQKTIEITTKVSPKLPVDKGHQTTRIIKTERTSVSPDKSTKKLTTVTQSKTNTKPTSAPAPNKSTPVRPTGTVVPIAERPSVLSQPKQVVPGTKYRPITTKPEVDTPKMPSKTEIVITSKLQPKVKTPADSVVKQTQKKSTPAQKVTGAPSKPKDTTLTNTSVTRNDRSDVIVTLRRSTSSRESTPNRICPQPTTDEDDYGTPRYPDQITEPPEYERKPFYIHGPKSEAPTDMRVDSVDETDESLLTVTEKVSKFVTEAEKLTNNCKTVDYLATQNMPERPKSPRCRNYSGNAPDATYTPVSKRVSQFTKTTETISSYQSPHNDVNKFTKIQDVPVSLSKLEISPKEPRPQIESQEPTCRRNVTEAKHVDFQKKIHEFDSPRSPTKDETKHILSTTGRLRSTETIRKAKELFENGTKSIKDVVNEEHVEIVDDEETKQPHYMKPLDRSVKPQEYDKHVQIPVHFQTKSPEPHTHDSSVEVLPHYMWPLNRVTESETHEKNEMHVTHTEAPHTIHTKSPEPHENQEGLPHYMWPLDRTVHEDVEREQTSTTHFETHEEQKVKQAHNEVGEEKPHYMKPLERTPHETQCEERTVKHVTHNQFQEEPHYMKPLERKPHDSQPAGSTHFHEIQNEKQTSKHRVDHYFEEEHHYMQPLDRKPHDHQFTDTQSVQQLTHNQFLENEPHYIKPLARKPHDAQRAPPSYHTEIHSEERTVKHLAQHQISEDEPHYMKPLERKPHDSQRAQYPHETDHPSRVDTPDTKSRKMSRGSTPDKNTPGYMKPLDRQPKTPGSLKNRKESLDIQELLEKSEFENVYDITLLEILLEKATTYEQRRRIRAQIRVLKHGMNDVAHVSDQNVKTSKHIVEKHTGQAVRHNEQIYHKSTHHGTTKTEYQTAYQSEKHTISQQKVPTDSEICQEKVIKKQQPKTDLPQRSIAVDDKPSWVKQRNLKKVSENPNTVSTITTTTRKQTASKTARPTNNEPTDVITSSYGVGPTDENGSPLFGLRALRVQNQTESKKVKGTVVESHYYSKNGQEPVGEIRVTKYSSDPRDLEGHVENKDGLLSVTTIQTIGPKSPCLNRKQITDQKITDVTDEEYKTFAEQTSSTRTVRRDSVKEMSKKFIDNAVETSKTERQPSYPKAGLILRTSSFKETSRNGVEKEPFPEKHDSSVRSVVTKTVTSSKGGRVDTFLTNKSRVQGVQDTITRMKNAEEDIQDGDSVEDIEARALLNKFIGSQVILSGMESRSSVASGTSNATRTTTTTTTITREGEKPTVITRTFTHPITEEDLSNVWDEETLKLLLERSTEYEERRIIRSRLRDIMAEQETCADIVPHQSTEESSNRAEEVETSRTTSSDGSTTTNTVTTRITSQQVTKKPLSPFAKFRQLDKQNSLNSPGTPRTPTGSGPLFKFTDPELSRQASTVKERLLQWCQMKTKEYENVQLDNFSSSWSDGLAFCALIHHFLPDAFDYHALTSKERRHNFDLAFRIADEKANIAPLLDVEDMIATRKPDWKCVFTYVQTIYARFKNED